MSIGLFAKARFETRNSISSDYGSERNISASALNSRSFQIALECKIRSGKVR